VNGKSTFKEEFVTAGGIDLKEINFKTMESKLHENLYFAGEIVNIDAVLVVLTFKMLGQVDLFWQTHYSH
jgi:predicted flavoprotein YhiN